MRNSLNKSPGPWPLVLPARLCGAAAGNQPSGCLVFQVLSQLLTLLEDLDLLVERPEIQVTSDRCSQCHWQAESAVPLEV